MKKLLVLFLALLLLLTACVRLPVPTGSSAQSSAAPTERTEPASTQTPDPGGSITAGGVHVHTDWSGYKPYEPQKAVYSRLREEPLLAFAPSEDYGAVFPYAASILFSSGDGGYGWRQGELYGLTDRTGRILTDGIYNSIRPLTSYDYSALDYRETHYPYWIVRSSANGVIHEEEEGEYSWSWAEADIRYGLVSADGSFALPCAYYSIQATAGGLLCLGENGWLKPDFEFYDFEGRLLFRGEELLPDDTDSWSLDWGEGLYCVGWEKSEKSEYWFCDADGKRVLGIYRGASVFREGLACVSVDGTNYGYIDKSGAWVIDPVFRGSGYGFRDGLTMQYTWNGTVVMMDHSGNYVLELPDSLYINRTPYGFEVNDWNNGKFYYYDNSGALILEEEGSGWNDLDEQTFFHGEYGNCRIFRLSGEELVLKNADTVQKTRLLLDGELRDGYLASGYNYVDETYEYSRYFVSADLGEARKLDSVQFWSEGYPYERDRNFSRTDEITGELWYFENDGSVWNGVTDAGRRCRLSQYPERVFNGVFQTESGGAWVLMDENGVVFFRMPLDAED